MYRFAKIFQVLTVEEIDKESEPKTYLKVKWTKISTFSILVQF